LRTETVAPPDHANRHRHNSRPNWWDSLFGREGRGAEDAPDFRLCAVADGTSHAAFPSTEISGVEIPAGSIVTCTGWEKDRLW